MQNSIKLESFVQTLSKKRGLLSQFLRTKKTLSGRDLQLIWHPFTQAKTAGDPIPIVRASGSYIYDDKGKAYLDLVSSWWVNIHGHCHPEIAEAIFKQAKSLDHVMFAGFTHEPAVTLCESLTEILAPKFKRFFFSDNGSTAVEVALKMAYQFWINRKSHERRHFLCFEGGYHGDTFGAMSVGRGSGYFDTFRNLFFETLLVPFPATWNGDSEVENNEGEALTVLERHLNENGKSIAAIILEPLVQGASGMRMCRPQFLEKVVDLVKQHSCLVIFDEVMAGFGRTGTFFAHDQLPDRCHPDFLCVSKGITGGFLPLALTITTEEIYEAFLGDDFKSAFVHGHSYTANPISCAAALKSLEILRRPETIASIQRIQDAHVTGLKELSESLGTIVVKARNLGTISGFEISGKWDFDLNLYLKKKFPLEGLILRPLANTIYMMPPLCTTSQEIRTSYATVSKVLSEIA